jgi:hypothetical protein
MLRFCSASSVIPDSTKAASAALRAALVGTDAAECRLVMFHVTMGHDAGAGLRTLRALYPGQLVARTGGRRPVGVFHTDCGARGRPVLDHVSKDETVARMQHPLFGDDCGPWLGMYGFGEVTFLDGRNLFYNYTSSLYVFPRGQA